MAYLGHRPAVGENNSFRILDDISSYVLTFDGSSASAVSLSNETITMTEDKHRYITGQRVTYSNGGGGNITGLVNGQAYFVINHSSTEIKLASSASNALAGTAVNLTGLGTGSSHTLTLAFDGVNTKFDPTFGNGMHDTLIKRAAQLVISINGVIQQPHDTATPSTGFGVDSLGHIIFSTAPASTDIFWGHILASNTVTFDSSDNDVDTFTGDGSTTSFTLSKIPPDNRNILVTIDGVVQYPSDAANTRSYNVSENVMTFVAAPGLGTVIQVRHIGYAGIGAGGGGGVTGFYGRTGNVSLVSTDNIVANNATFNGNVSIAQTLTYEDVTDIDSVGLITARSGIKDQTLTAGRVVYVDSDKTLTDSSKLTFGSSGVLNLMGASGNTQLALFRTDANTTGTAGIVGFYASDNHVIASMYALGDGDNEGAHLVFNTTSAASGTNPYSNVTERLRIKSDGGILQTKTGGNANYTISRNESVGTTDQAIGVLDFASNTGHTVQARVMGKTRGTSNIGGDLVFETRPDNGSLDEKVRITGDGRLGIGTDNPDTLVEIGNAIGTGTANLLKLTSYTNSQNSRPGIVFWNNNPNTAQAQISAKGGASYNASKLHFSVANSSRVLQDRACIDEFGTFIIGPGETRRNTKGSNQHQVLLIEGTGNNSTRMSMIRNTNDDNGPEIQLIKTRGTSVGSVTKPNQNDYIGSLVFIGGDDTDLYSRGAEISVQATGTPANDRIPSDIIFSTTPTSGATAPQQRLRIDSTGAVRINNTRTTATKLHVVGGTASGTAYDVAVFAGGQNSTQNSGVKLYLSGCENNPLSRGVILESIATTNDNAHRFSILVSGSSAAPAERFRINSSGEIKCLGNQSIAPGGQLGIRFDKTGTTTINVENLSTSSVNNQARLALRTNNGYAYFSYYNQGELYVSNPEANGYFVYYGNTDNGASQRLRINSNGRISISGNTTNNAPNSPDGNLHIQDSSAGTVTADADANELILESGGNTGMSILSPGSGESSIYFGNPGTNGQKEAWIKYYHETHSTTANRRALTFKSGGGSEKMRLDSYGNLLINTDATGGTTFHSSSYNGSLQVHDASLVLSKVGTGTRNWRFVNNNVATGNLGIQCSTSDDGGTSYGNVIEITKTKRVGIVQTTPLASLHVGTESGNNVAFQVGTISGQNRYLAINHYNNQQNFYQMKMRVNDNGLVPMLDMGNPYGSQDHGTKIKFSGYNDSEVGAIESVNTADNSTSSVDMVLRTGSGPKEVLRLQSNGDARFYNGLAIAKYDNDYSGFTRAGLVLSTPVYNEYHFTWSGQSSYTIDFTCGSYFHAEFTYVQHQTNGGHHIHHYVRGKWANNHTTHTGFIYEHSGNGGACQTTFTASDQSGNGAVDMKGGLTEVGSSGASYRHRSGGGHEGTSGSANGRLRLVETYGPAGSSVATRGVVLKIYYGSLSGASIS